MKGIRCWAAAVLAIAAVTSAFAISLTPFQDEQTLVARPSAAGDVVAVITPLPDFISNGSYQDLDGSDSYDPDGGLIIDWSWEIEHNGTFNTSHATSHHYYFPETGLYKITLTVTDTQGDSNRSFTAVVAVLDMDSDSMPDWWEEHYFGNLDQTGSDDYDSDAFTNLEEFAMGTDPTVKDPQPGFTEQMRSHWYVFAIVAAIIVGIVLALWPVFRKRRMVHEKKKIEAAIAIEKALEQEEK